MDYNQFSNITAIKPEQLIGTKWLGLSETFSDRYSLEFINNTKCIYTSKPKKFPLTYNVEDGKLYIYKIQGFFELRGDTLFNNDLPVFRKTA